MWRLLALAAGDGGAGLFVGVAFAFRFALVPDLLALGQGEFALHLAIAKIKTGGDERKSFLLRLNLKLVNLGTVEQQFTGAQRVVIAGIAVGIRADVGVEQEDFAVLDEAVGVFEVGLALADGFDFGAAQSHAGFDAVGKEVVVAGSAIERGIAVAAGDGISGAFGFGGNSAGNGMAGWTCHWNLQGLTSRSAWPDVMAAGGMAGGAAMIGAMRAIAQLKPAVKVIGIVCATENMPDGKAQKPGDVRTAMSGKTIEIINTDAEGRLVLADGLAYARSLGATRLIDAATLTGAVMVALGNVYAGVFSNDEYSYEKFRNASVTVGERFWRMPLHADYREQIKSGIADMINTGGRWGGASTAAALLEEFAEKTPWVHLDIAGTAWIEDARPYIAKGPSGIAVRSIIEWVNSFSN